MAIFNESTAAQRHYGVTTRDYLNKERRYESRNNSDDIDDDDKKEIEMYQKMSGIMANRMKHHRIPGDSYEVYGSRGVIDKNKTRKEAEFKGDLGSYNTIAHSRYGIDSGKNHRSGYDYAEYKEKKNAIKEACLQILADLDEV